MQYQPDQSARVADDRLRSSVRALDHAQHCAVLWFADILSRKLYRELGYASMQLYACEGLGFSKTRYHDFKRLAAGLERLPRTRARMAAGELGYTKARLLVQVASPRTEEQWLQSAAKLSRRELERKTRRVKEKAKRRRAAAQVELLPESRPDEEPLAASVPVRFGLTLTAEQHARLEALWASLGTTPNAEDLLEGLALLADARGTTRSANHSDSRSNADESPRGNARPPVQIHVHQCPGCGKMEAQGRALDAADRERARCDAAIATPGHRNATTIPPRVRRHVLARDRHRCRAPGCTHTRFLEVHHIEPRAAGGSNDPANLITLCAACHRLQHEHPGTALAEAVVP